MIAELQDLKLKIEFRYPSISFVSTQEDEYLCLEFSTSFQNDYKFYLLIPDDLISATIGATIIKDSNPCYFWYYPYDHYDDDFDRLTEVTSFLFDNLDIITKYETRITQKNGILFQSFNCEYLINNHWTILYKHSAFKYSKFKFPKIRGRKKMYI